MKVSSTVFLILALGCASHATPARDLLVASPPTAQELRALGLLETATVRPLEFNSREFEPTFKVFECKDSTRVCYVLRFGQISDFVCSERKVPSGELAIWSNDEVLRFFILRFRAIWNDVKHKKPRPDVGLKLSDDDSDKGDVLLAGLYGAVAEHMEKVRIEELK